MDTSQSGEPGQVLGASVTLTAYPAERADELLAVLAQIMDEAPTTLDGALPLLAIETPSPEIAERAFDLLEERGGTVRGGRVWMDPIGHDGERPACPACGSEHTQPFAHAGPGARVNMKCIDCGHRFKATGMRTL